MIFHDHHKLNGRHAFLSPSQYSWSNYIGEDRDESLERMIQRSYAKRIGTLVHSFAEKHIRYGVKIGTSKPVQHELLVYLLSSGIPESAIDMEFIFYNLAAYINDAVKFHMKPEVVLAIPNDISGVEYGVPPAFGTADAISFKNDKLRIHDLKTGTTPAHMEQLLIYAALFCLEYGEELGFRPKDIEMELRIYQANEVSILNPTEDDIVPVIDQVVYCSQFIADHYANGKF